MRRIPLEFFSFFTRVLTEPCDFGHSIIMLSSKVLDYLEIYPQHQEWIALASLSNLLSLGPWFVQPDEFLVSGESIIRNLLFGIRHAIRIGGNPMMIGYLPDSFGHIAQLPQLYKGFDIEFAAFSRGISNTRLEFMWSAPGIHHVMESLIKKRFDAGCIKTFLDQ